MLIQGDARRIPLKDGSVQCVVTSPPYWGLRDYGVAGQLGLERTPEEYIGVMLEVFREVKRVLREDGTLWLNMGDSYSNDTKWGGKSGGKNAHSALGGYQGQRVRWGNDCDPKRGVAALGQPFQANPGPFKPKDLVGMPWMLALALRADGWYLRSDIIWSKPNPMPESVTDRPTKAHEYIFLLSKSQRYYYDAEAILEPVSENTHMRLAQNVAAQIGSTRANGGAKTNGNMKAVGRRPKAWDVDMGSNRTLISGYPRRSQESWNGSKFDDPRDLEIRPNTGRKRVEAGLGIKYNDSFDAACILPVEARNKRSVWTVNVQGFFGSAFRNFSAGAH